MNRVPFSAYDFFGYLASGFLVLVGIAVVTGHAWVLGGNLPASVLFLATFAAYTAGHVVAHISSSFFEHTIARRALRSPECSLLGQSNGHRLRRSVFRGYYKPLPEIMRKRIWAKAEAKGWGADERAIFLQGLTVVRRDATAAGRLDSFLNLYGFARNTAMVFFLIALGLVFSKATFGAGRNWLVSVSLACGFVMFLRFLKFYRLYTQEVFANITEVP